MTATDSTYTGAQISVLRGLEPVKVRPGMYTRTSHPAHILQEVIDNAADEALAGYAKNIWLTIESDGSYTIRDDGRGIPVDAPPGEERPAVELVFSTLHAGGKFDHSGEHAAYRFSGGLHGVGVAVTNALSLELSVEVQRDGSVWRLDFADGGEIRQPLTQIGTCGPRTHGTKVRVKPDPRYFDSPRVSVAGLRPCCARKPCCCLV